MHRLERVLAAHDHRTIASLSGAVQPVMSERIQPTDAQRGRCELLVSAPSCEDNPPPKTTMLGQLQTVDEEERNVAITSTAAVPDEAPVTDPPRRKSLTSLRLRYTEARQRQQESLSELRKSYTGHQKPSTRYCNGVSRKKSAGDAGQASPHSSEVQQQL